jgi:ADP-ribosylglycohydrolase
MLPDRSARLASAHLSLLGLSIGDAFGQLFFTNPDPPEPLIERRVLPRSPWIYTDDTEMAISILKILEQHGRIDQDALASRFADRYRCAPRRGYGGTATRILRSISLGEPWQTVAGAVFDGQGSMGNGGAMRAAPLGAFFADDVETLVHQARLSAEVTHAHPEGQAGAIAVALAAAWAWNHRDGQDRGCGGRLLEFVHDQTPDGDTRAVIAEALSLPENTSVALAVSTLGNGGRLTSADTVPFALWCAARHLDSYEEALWTTVSGLGDRDTTCAIVGGIVVLAAGAAAIPPDWFAAREPVRYE